MIATLTKSDRKNKKWKVVIDGRSAGHNGGINKKTKKTIHFGDSRFSDYTKHKNKSRMEKYVARHRKRENWTRSGIKTAGFWAKHLIWNKPSLEDSIKDIEKRFNIDIVYRG